MRLMAEYIERSEWIPVTERLPEAEYGESEDVLTIDSLKVMRVAYFDGGNWCFPTGEPIETVTEFPITHWMPLPEPPKEEVQKIPSADMVEVVRCKDCSHSHETNYPSDLRICLTTGCFHSENHFCSDGKRMEEGT